MNSYTNEQIADLVRPDRVHHAVYSDPVLFALEMKRIFGRAWLALGHESQIATPGAFFTTHMAAEPVIVVRDLEGEIRVLVNRCTHRGPLVCHEARGETRQFVCPYHGWTFDPTGQLRFVPMESSYASSLCGREDLALAHVPRVASYRGFIFASLAAEGESLVDFLGPVASSYDDIVDRAPAGEVEVAGGMFRHAYNGNWKLVLENHIDTVHPAFVHQSSVHAAREQPDAESGDASTGGSRAGATSFADIQIRQMRQNGAPPAVWERLGIFAGPNGHGYMGDYHSDDRLVVAMANPVFAEYRAALSARVGAERATQILSTHRFNTIVYPNCSFMSQFRQYRIVQPIAVDRTIVNTFSFRLKGAPEAMFRDTVAFANIVNGTASEVLTDDLEVYERAQQGLSSGLVDWVYLGRGLGGDVPDSPGLRRGGMGTSELPMRNQFEAWSRYMTAEDATATNRATPRMAPSASTLNKPL